MKIFVIHRFNERKKAKSILKKISDEYALIFQPVFLDSSGGEFWRKESENSIIKSECVIVFNPKSCQESENAKWEIEKAKDKGKVIIEFDNGDNSGSIAKLIDLYELRDEFEKCFSSEKNNALELYKLMIDSSENLIQRRQKTSAFFITVIGSLIAIAGLLVKIGTLNGTSMGVLYGFSIVGLLLCNSWKNLIDNYGKLNKAKFDVILRLEKDLGAQIYLAEWVALGKGLRPQKYQSFTSTEKSVPFYFGLLIITLSLILLAWQIWG